MIDLKNRWVAATDRSAWTARGASFVAKAKATKAVWFPSAAATSPQKTPKAATRTTRRTTRRPTRKTASASRRAADVTTKKAT